MDNLKIGLIQMNVVSDKNLNIKKAEKMIDEASKKGAQLVILPEMFICPYDNQNFIDYAEKEGEETFKTLANIAKKNGVFLVGGSVPEIDLVGNIYNTCYIFDNLGNNIAKYRKMHLFDIDVEDGQKFKESDTLSSGNEVVVFKTPFAKIGIIICYDLRFPELSRLLVQKGAELIIVPASFNMTTGPLHWELLFRARAVDNQAYTIGVASATNHKSSYISYGNSLVVDPLGRVIDKLNGEENILIKDLNLSLIKKVREELPFLKHIRNDVYNLAYTKNQG